MHFHPEKKRVLFNATFDRRIFDHAPVPRNAKKTQFFFRIGPAEIFLKWGECIILQGGLINCNDAISPYQKRLLKYSHLFCGF